MSEEFGVAYAQANDDEKRKVNGYINLVNLEGLRCWIAKQLNGQDYAELSLRKLRSVAQTLGVPFYSRLPKASLLSEISRYEKAKNGIVPH